MYRETAIPEYSRLSKLFSFRNCVVLSVLLHAAFFWLPMHQNRSESVAGGMRMAFVRTAKGAGPHGEQVKRERNSRPANQTSKAPRSEQKTPIKHETSKPTPAPQLPRKSASPEMEPKPTTPVPARKPAAHHATSTQKQPDADSHAHNQRTNTAKSLPEKVTTTSVKQGHPDTDASSGELADQNGQQAQLSNNGVQGPVHARIGSLYGPQIKHWVRPRYPRKAKAMGKTGVVVLRITIDSHGHPIRVDIVRKAGFGFDEAAVSAITKSSFSPATHKGRPIACIALLPVHFNLKGH